MDGVLVIDKPVGPTSHDVVARVRRAIGERRVGHTGTLDPGASGVLPLVVGRATRLARFLSASDKSYEAVVRLGFSTDTADAQGRATGPVRQGTVPSLETIDAALDWFRGTFLQQPPAYSAKMIEGHRSYKLARAKSRTTENRPGPPDRPDLPELVSVTTQAIEIISLHGDTVTLRVDCSGGFYVRSLAHDLGERLGTGAHLVSLRRTRSADFSLRETIALGIVEREPAAAIAAMVPLNGMLLGLSSVVLTAQGAKHAGHGRDLTALDLASDLPAAVPSWIRLLDQDGVLLGIARPGASPGALHPSIVLM